MPAWSDLQLALSHQSDDMHARIAVANELLRERVARLINDDVLQHKTATRDLLSRIKEVEAVLQQWEVQDIRGNEC
eukprot:10180298-Karenia_brevis.AAC.1